jgi:hypothetical protein
MSFSLEEREKNIDHLAAVAGTYRQLFYRSKRKTQLPRKHLLRKALLVDATTEYIYW